LILIYRIHATDGPDEEVERTLRLTDEPLRADEAVLGAAHLRTDGLGPPLLRIDVDLLLRALHLPQALLRIEDRKVVGPPEPLRVPSEDTRSESVEGAHPHPPGGSAQQFADPLPHLPRRLVGEGDGEDPIGRHTVLEHQMCDAGRQYPCLPGSRAGQHERRTVDVLDGLSLFGIELVEIDGGR